MQSNFNKQKREVLDLVFDLTEDKAIASTKAFNKDIMSLLSTANDLRLFTNQLLNSNSVKVDENVSTIIKCLIEGYGKIEQTAIEISQTTKSIPAEVEKYSATVYNSQNYLFCQLKKELINVIYNKDHRVDVDVEKELVALIEQMNTVYYKDDYEDRIQRHIEQAIINVCECTKEVAEKRVHDAYYGYKDEKGSGVYPLTQLEEAVWLLIEEIKSIVAHYDYKKTHTF